MKKELKKLMQYARDKTGMSSDQKLMGYQAALTHMVLPDILPFDKTTLSRVKEQVQKNFGVKNFKTEVHKNDLMFSYHLYHMGGQLFPALYSHYAVGARFAQGLAGLINESEIDPAKILDFGSGYGRVSRFLPHFFPDSKVRVSEVKDQALHFQNEVLGFSTLHHSSDPESFQSERFDLIIAVSVFTHLPRNLFDSWLVRLHEHLTPGGALVFTYNDIETADKKLLRESGESDFLYLENSEDSLLSFIPDANINTEEYGHAYIGKELLEQKAEELGFELEFLADRLTAKQHSVIFTKK